MLTSLVDATPRPPPPSKARRVSSNPKLTPPPPYVANSGASRNESLMPAQRVDWEALRHDTPLPSPVDEEWLDGRSRRNLAQLLSKAGEVIRERENGTSQIGYACNTGH
jgi:hypothetical protein